MSRGLSVRSRERVYFSLRGAVGLVLVLFTRFRAGRGDGFYGFCLRFGLEGIDGIIGIFVYYLYCGAGWSV